MLDIHVVELGVKWIHLAKKDKVRSTSVKEGTGHISIELVQPWGYRMYWVLKRGSSGVCALWSVIERNQKNRRKRAKIRSADRRPKIMKGKGVSLLEDDGLDTLPINPL